MQFVDGVRPRTPLTPILSLAPATAAIPQVIPQPPTNRRYVSMDSIGPRRMMPAAAPLVEASVLSMSSEYLPATRQGFVLPWRSIGLTSLALTIAASTAFGLYQYRLTQLSSPAVVTAQRSEQAAPAVATETTTTTPALNNGPTAQEAAAAVALQSSQIQGLINNFAVGAPAGIIIKDLKTGAVGGVNQTQVFTSASLYKLFVAHGIYKQVDGGQRRLTDRIGGRSIAECLNLMITVSDNGCAEALGSLLGWGKYNSTLKSYGFAQTKFGSPMQTSANDVAILLERLYGGTLLSPSSTDNFMGLLKSQRIKNRLPKGLPAGTVIAHKTGDLNGLVHDAGIVFGPKTDYIIVMASGPWATPSVAPAKFAELSKTTWANLEQ